VDAHNAEAVARICRDLDGLPLALELAAPRLASLSPKEVAERLGERFHLLAGGRGTPARHRSLQAALDWSYQLLSEGERRLFDRLSVFRGGWTLEAAEPVCAGEGVEAGAVVELLGSLVDKSLVLAETTAEGGTRYRLLETLREYGQQQLARRGEVDRIGQKHADYYVRLAEDAETGISADEAAVIARLKADEDNLFAAMERSLNREAGAVTVRLGSALSPYMADTARRWSEYVDLVSQALDQRPRVVYVARCKALCQVAYFDYLSGRVERAQAATEEALQLAQANGDRAWMAMGLFAKGFCLKGEASRVCFAEAANHTRATGYGDAAISLRFLAEFEPLETAQALMQEYAAYAQRVATPGELAAAACGLADLAVSQGELAEADRQWQAACRYLERIGNQWNQAEILLSLARIAWSGGDYERAAALLDESLDLVKRSGWLPGLASTLRCKGILAWWRGDMPAAERWYRESDISASRWNRPAVRAVTGSWWTKWARDMGDLAEAVTYGEQALQVLLEGATVGKAGWCQAALASVAHYQGDAARAVTLYQTALQIMPHDRNLLDLRDVLEGGALALAATGEHRMAARLLGFTAGRLAAFGIVRPVPEQRFYDQEVERLKTEMPPDVLAQLWEAGRALTFEQAVAEALGAPVPQAV
jgi:tetratricopeptide (TPR) repeat protein